MSNTMSNPDELRMLAGMEHFDIGYARLAMASAANELDRLRVIADAASQVDIAIQSDCPDDEQIELQDDLSEKLKEWRRFRLMNERETFSPSAGSKP